MTRDGRADGAGCRRGRRRADRSLEYSAQHSGNSASIGASEGIGFAGSVGFRDADGDGNVELCNRVEVFWVSGGYCVELPVTLPKQNEILPAPTEKR